jgi:hypothetical protein
MDACSADGGEDESTEDIFYACDGDATGTLNPSEFEKCYNEQCDKNCPTVDAANAACVCHEYEDEAVFTFYDQTEPMGEIDMYEA